jgi:hypothetical protein
MMDGKPKKSLMPVATPTSQRVFQVKWSTVQVAVVLYWHRPERQSNVLRTWTGRLLKIIFKRTCKAVKEYSTFSLFKRGRTRKNEQRKHSTVNGFTAQVGKCELMNTESRHLKLLIGTFAS